MSFYLSIPILFFRFWYLDAPVKLLKYFSSVNHAALQILSLELMVRTFFKPLKNEYRKGLVPFSIGLGMFVKSVLIFTDLFMLLLLIGFELIMLTLFILWPMLTIFILFIN